MTAQRWRDVWDETRAAMNHLEESMEVVRGLERSRVVEERSRVCSDGVTKALALMRESVDQVRRQMHAADVQLTAAVDLLMAESLLDEEKV